MHRWYARRVVVLLLVGACVRAAGAPSAQELARRPRVHETRIPYTSLPPDPSHLLDLELSNVLLATTIDGSLLGVDRTSGAVLWDLSSSHAASVPDLLQPLVASHFGADHRTLEQLAADAVAHGDTETLRVLESGGIYVVEPSSGGDLYMLRTRTEHGESRPQLEKMPFSLPDLVALSPFSLSSDDTRIFVAEKHTRLVELNVFTGSIGTVFDAKDAFLYDVPHRAAYGGARQDDRSEYDAIESPWVYVGRTDYTLTIHVRHTPSAAQTLHYSVYAPNSADQDTAALWAQHGAQIDRRGVLIAPEEKALVCFDLSRIPRARRNEAPRMPPVLWTRTLNTSVVDLFDVVFVPPTAPAADTPLLRPIIAPHTASEVAQIVQQQRSGVASHAPSAYLGMSPGGSLYALGQSRYPLVELAAPAAATTGQVPSAHSLQPWLGGYEVPNQPPPRAVPLLDAPFRDHVPQLGAPAALPKPWVDAPGLLALRVLGLALFVFVVVRGYVLIRRDRSPLLLTTEALHFDGEAPADAKERLPAADAPEARAEPREAHDAFAPERAAPDAPVAPEPEASGAADTSLPVPESERGDASESESPQPAPTPEEDTKRRRRRRGKRAGAAVLARQAPAARREDSAEPAPGPMPPREATPSGGEVAPSALQISDEVLGYGSSGTVVFRGTFQGRAVAVKRLLRDFVLMASKEVSLLQSADNHPNVIRYFCQELTPNFLYIALEQCPASLADLVERPVEYAHLAQLFEPRQAFRQITAGLQHLHSLSIVHRDIKPQNILVTLGTQNKLRMLLSDFGLSKRMDGVAQSSFSQSFTQPGGTVGWRAPEVLRGQRSLLPRPESEESARLTRAVDIFSLGCVAFYMLTRGAHPFGSQYEREMHIMQDAPDLTALDEVGEDTAEAHALIRSMIAHDATARPSAERVAQHPFFWSAQRRLSFLQDVSDRLETLEREPPSLAVQLLERDADAVIGADWRRRFDRAFLEDLGRFRKYDRGSVQDLLRVIRNKKHHFQDMQPQLKKQLSPMPEGFLLFFTRRFPQLFLHVYQAMEQLPMLRSEPMFRGYYQDEDA
ncbi:non-specific serine/threonine protein kinase [Malassezia obtusa]|uniref:non-specific serine/threonine protein kinase n=1 Tax=Malassezia obtusa TaxID=76774 RepID=A0AAF0E0D6_9BASI|nr:non-specific serine/threonine protein kinase [Malassezia obtusa]